MNTASTDSTLRQQIRRAIVEVLQAEGLSSAGASGPQPAELRTIELRIRGTERAIGVLEGLLGDGASTLRAGAADPGGARALVQAEIIRP